MPELPDELLNELTPAEWRLVVSLVEAIATSDEGTCPTCHRQVDRTHLAEHIEGCHDTPVLRTRRLEIVDDRGRPCAVLGELPKRSEYHRTVGLALLDPDGKERVVLALDHEGVQLEFIRQGNTVLLLGIEDDGPETAADTFLLLMDRNGVPVQSWRVAADGELVAYTQESAQ